MHPFSHPNGDHLPQPTNRLGTASQSLYLAPALGPIHTDIPQEASSNTPGSTEIAITAHNPGMPSTGSVTTAPRAPQVSTIQHSLNPLTPQIQTPSQVQVISRGSLNFLQKPDFFWSGQTLEDLRFNDRRLWHEQRHPPHLPTATTNQQPLEYDHPNEHLHKTTSDDIIEIFRRQRPKSFHQHVGTWPDGQLTPQLLKAGTNGWVLTYLDGSTERALEFREAMLRSFPFPGGGAEGFTILDIFCSGIPYFDADGHPSPVRAALGCPPHVKVLAIMRVQHLVGYYEGVAGPEVLGCRFYDEST